MFKVMNCKYQDVVKGYMYNGVLVAVKGKVVGGRYKVTFTNKDGSKDFMLAFDKSDIVEQANNDKEQTIDLYIKKVNQDGDEKEYFLRAKELELNLK